MRAQALGTANYSAVDVKLVPYLLQSGITVGIKLLPSLIALDSQADAKSHCFLF